MKKQWEPVELLSHSRHDWLNQIQLIKANLSLNRVERAHEIIEEISTRSHHSSKLSNLNIPSVTEMLLTFNWEDHPYRLSVEVHGKIRTLEVHEEGILKSLTQWFEKLDECADLGKENYVKVNFHLEEEAVYVSVVFSGALKNHESFLNDTTPHNGAPIIEQYASKESFEVTLKWVTR